MNLKHFRIGDKVKFVSKKKNWAGDKVGDIHIINNIHLEWDMAKDGTDVPYFEYSTNHGAWYPHNNFELVEEATIESLRELFADIQEEEEGDME